MAQFAYDAITKEGQHAHGVLAAGSREEALSALRAQGSRPLTIKESADAGAKKNSFFTNKKVKLHDLMVFTRELSTMVSAGVSLPRCLETLAGQAENPYFKSVINGVNHEVGAGSSLADAMAKYPNVFSDVYINMVRAGEAGGILDDILKRLALQVEKDATIRKKIRSAMAYPVVILCITIIAFFGIMLFILPKIGNILHSLGGPNAKFPIYTQIMLDISNFLKSSSIVHAILPPLTKVPILSILTINAVLFIIIFAVGIAYLRRWTKTPTGAYKYHSFLLRIPVFGKIIAKIAVARFARTFSALMGSGVSVLDALEITGKAVGNKVIQKELVTIAEKVRNGQPLGKQFAEAQYFPAIVGQMISVGEETGNIGDILVKVADFYDEEVDVVIDSLSSLIEPLMIIVLGSLVGLIAASVMGPIANLSKNVGG
ncbi:MAG TPA: type II secretion system F family protein [Candidatus Saccharimonadales bacterium]|nr:type II secretion system F family protein [Candidatus Saccharimonadales bacterium]